MPQFLGLPDQRCHLHHRKDALGIGIALAGRLDVFLKNRFERLRNRFLQRRYQRLLWRLWHRLFLATRCGSSAAHKFLGQVGQFRPYLNDLGSTAIHTHPPASVFARSGVSGAIQALPLASPFA